MLLRKNTIKVTSFYLLDLLPYVSSLQYGFYALKQF